MNVMDLSRTRLARRTLGLSVVWFVCLYDPAIAGADPPAMREADRIEIQSRDKTRPILSIPGEASGEVNSIKITVRMGKTYGNSAGGVILQADVPRKNMTLPQSLNWLGSSRKRGLEVLTDPQNPKVIRQAWTASTFMDVTSDPDSVHGATVIRMYHSPDPMPGKVDGVYPVDGLEPYRVSRIEALAVNEAGEVTQVLLSGSALGNPAVDQGKQWLWTWVQTEAGDTGWDMAVGPDLVGNPEPPPEWVSVTHRQLDEKIRQKTRVTINRVRGRKTHDQKLVETFKTFPWGEELIEKRLEVLGDLTEHTRYAYYDDQAADPDNFRMRRSVIEMDGSWEHYRYDEIGQTIETITSLHGNPYRPEDLEQLRRDNLVETFGRHMIDLADGDEQADDLRRWSTIRAGVVESCKYEVIWSQSNPAGQPEPQVYETWDITADDDGPEAKYDDLPAFVNAMLNGVDEPGVRITKTRRFDQGHRHEWEVAWVQRPDGSIRAHDFPRDGVIVTTRGRRGPADGAAEELTRTTRETHSSGHLISEYTEALRAPHAGGPERWVPLRLEKKLTQDDFGRATSTGYYFDADAAAERDQPGSRAPAYVTRQSFGPHGVATRTDRDGNVTRYTYDTLGRLASVVLPDGTVIEYTPDPDGRPRRRLDGQDDDPLIPTDDWPSGERPRAI